MVNGAGDTFAGERLVGGWWYVLLSGNGARNACGFYALFRNLRNFSSTFVAGVSSDIQSYL